LINAFRESYKNDSDGDGVSDVFDKELNTPDGALVDGSGRAMDTDKDSIPDYKDKCPTQAGRAANNGCPVQATKGQLMVINDGIKNLQFETGQTIIKSSSFPALDKLAELLVDNQIFLFRIDGHTDNVGDSVMNIVLSQGRADAVKNYLVSKGVDASRISATGYGSNRPVVSNSTEAGRARNRRVDMQVE
jgi:OOP family OmpA-OmpF porin